MAERKRGKSYIFMQRRISESTDAIIKLSFCCCQIDYSGTITNISENGMLIHIDKICFPFDLYFEILIPLWKKTINIHVDVVRITQSPDDYDCIGVRVLNPDQNYIKFVDSLRALYKREFREYQTTDVSA